MSNKSIVRAVSGQGLRIFQPQHEGELAHRFGVVEENPWSGSEAEDTTQRIKSPTQTSARVLRAKLSRKVESKSIASSPTDK